MDNEEIVIKPVESNDAPKLLVAICLVNFIYLAYNLIGIIALAPFFESKSLIYFSIIMSIAGLISNFGLLSMRKWALFAYTIIWIINLIASFVIGDAKPFVIFFSFIVLLVIWGYEDKMAGKSYSVEDGAWLAKEKDQERQVDFASNENESGILIENTESDNAKPYEIEEDNSTFKISEWNQIKERIYTNSSKLIISALCLWSFIHTYLIVKSYQFEYIEYQGLKLTLDGEIFSSSSKFYPFTSSGGYSRFDVRYYDFTEYFVYVAGAWMIYFLYRYLKGSKVVS